MRPAGAAIAGSLLLVGLTGTPGALAAPESKPKPGASSHTPSKPPPPPPPPPCPTPQSYPAGRLQAIPWAQQRLDFASAWKFTRGKGVTVAVVDSGVTASHPQLAGKVREIDLTGTRPTDCNGHGTQVAGIIAARDELNAKKPIPFVGVAPDARIISIKIQNAEQSEDGGLLLAKGIEEAVRENADIINVSVTNVNFPALHRAVLEAKKKGILVVAAAGNTDPEKKASEQAAYPASYPEVLSVGALGPTGPLSSFSNTTSRVDVAAPGDAIISTRGVGYVGQLQGTSFAAPYVAGVAALIKSYKPGLTATQIRNRIINTADGNVGVGSGNGMVNPLRAVTTINGDSAPARRPTVNVQPIVLGGPAPVDHRSRTIGGVVAAIAMGVSVLVVFAGVVAPMGRRRGWRPGRAAPIMDDRIAE
jgi:type VII secretion-associated serine protease mycosin